MPFKTIMRNLVNAVPGARGAILADWEGEAVDQFSLFDEYELKVVGAHKGIILAQMKEIHEKLFDSLLNEAVITTEQQRLIVAPVGPEYSLVMTLERGAVIGCALHRFRQAVRLLEKEIY